MTVKKTTQLRTLIEGPSLDFLMEAHDGVSAKIAEEAGFKGIWGSGLTLSASAGVRDNNELSWSQVAEQMAFMSDCTTVPILLDGDTGHGNFNNMRRLVKRLEQVDVAGVTIEDKLFPKLNSFLRSDRQPLADVDEFCGKIKAGKDSQRDPDFVIVARVEALIAGWGMSEAVRRAEAYCQAGADAILMHSKQSTPAEIFEFLGEWAGRLPIVLVPTKYYTTSAADFRERGVNVVIWANHLLRAAIVAMQDTARRIHQEESLINVEPHVASLQEVFRLQGDHELQEAEERYLPTSSRVPLGAVVLAAGGAGEFGPLTTDVPKAMLRVHGQPIVGRLADDFASFGSKTLTIVRGHHATAVEVLGASYVENAEYRETGEAYSLALAADALQGNTLVSFGDLVLKRHIIHSLLDEAHAGITLVVDSKLAGTDQPDLVQCDRPYTGKFELSKVHATRIGRGVAPKDADGDWIGLMHVGADGATQLRDAIQAAERAGTLRRDRICDLLTRILAAGGTLRVAYIYGQWMNVNKTADLLDAAAL